MAGGDFHLHSTASDGVRTPTWVVQTAATHGVRVLALTDHDTTAGLAEASMAAARLGVRLIPGVEISTDLGTADVHLLGYGFRPDAREFQDFLSWQREGRIGRLDRIIAILGEEGAAVSRERVLAIAGDATVGRPHVARALVEAGHVRAVDEAFDRWLGNGKVADVPRPKLAPADAISTVHDAGGIVVIAHPLFIGPGYGAAVGQLAGWQADGLETYYKHYDPETVTLHATLAATYGLVCSGGSDYHGLGNPDDREIGDIPFPDDKVDAFVSFLEAHCVETGAGGPV